MSPTVTRGPFVLGVPRLRDPRRRRLAFGVGGAEGMGYCGSSRDCGIKMSKNLACVCRFREAADQGDQSKFGETGNRKVGNEEWPQKGAKGAKG